MDLIDTSGGVQHLSYKQLVAEVPKFLRLICSQSREGKFPYNNANTPDLMKVVLEQLIIRKMQYMIAESLTANMEGEVRSGPKRWYHYLREKIANWTTGAEKGHTHTE